LALYRAVSIAPADPSTLAAGPEFTTVADAFRPTLVIRVSNAIEAGALAGQRTRRLRNEGKERTEDKKYGKAPFHISPYIDQAEI
jgi:hypothetical protein